MKKKNKTRLGTYHPLPIIRSAWQVCLSAAVLVCLALSGFVSHPVQAADPVDLVVSGEGAEPWNLTDVKPCFTGTKTVTLTNAGTRGGRVTIWLSDIVSREGSNPESETGDTAEPGELDGYLRLGVELSPGTESRLTTNLTLPAAISEFPASASDSKYIRVSPLNPGATVTLVWRWELPCHADNKVQGDSVSFSINYMIEELPAPWWGGGLGGGATPFNRCPATLTVDMEGNITAVAMTKKGILCAPCLATDVLGRNSLVLDEDTKLTLANKAIPGLITVRVSPVALPIAENIRIISPIYEFKAYPSAGEAIPLPVTISPPAGLTLSYEPGSLPEGTEEVFIGRYDSQLGWLPLMPVGGLVAEPGKARGLVEGFSFFAVLARVEEPTVDFRVSDLTISPSQIFTNEEVTISVRVANTGTKGGSYCLVLRVNGTVRAATTVTLAAGASEVVGFTITAGTAGKHQVEVNGLAGEFEVTELEVVEPAVPPRVNWWLIVGIACLALLLAAWFVAGMRARKRTKGKQARGTR